MQHSTKAKTKQAEIPETVRPRLLKAIHELLRAGRNVAQVAEALSPQQSFGKYDGCTRQAIQELAVAECKQLNAQLRKAYREEMAVLHRHILRSPGFEELVKLTGAKFRQ